MSTLSLRIMFFCLYFITPNILAVISTALGKWGFTANKRQSELRRLRGRARANAQQLSWKPKTTLAPIDATVNFHRSRSCR